MQFIVFRLLSLYTSGRTTGIVLDSGDGVSYAVPIYIGQAFSSSVLTTELAGSACTKNLVSILEELRISSSYHFDVIRDMKEKLCYVTLNYEQEMQNYKQDAADHRSYELPDGNVAIIQNQRFRGPELLFNPQLFSLFNKSLQTPSIHELLKNSIKQCDIDLRMDLYENIVISGGNAMLPGFQERLSKELKQLVPQNQRIKVNTLYQSDRQFSAWLGGAIWFKSIDQWIKKDEFEEYGSTIVHRKCF